MGLHRSFGQLDGRGLKFSWLNRPFLASLLIICNLCLVGFPFSSGFYSKDCGFEFTLGSLSFFNLVYFILSFSIALSCVYRLKIISNFLRNYLLWSVNRGKV